MKTRIIGVDCATDPRKVGIASFVHGSGGPLLASACSRRRPPSQAIAELVHDQVRTILSLDAPLGWPSAFGPAFSAHRAGMPVAVEPNRLFRRHTDRFVKRRIGKQPLDVGADRIARTAHAALALLEELREITRDAIPLVWTPTFARHIGAIEVYPAATLHAHGLPFDRYKKPGDRARRELLLRALGKRMPLPADCEPLLQSADVLDAAICVLAGIDFLQGRAIPPGQEELARKEGWIWVADPDSTSYSV